MEIWQSLLVAVGGNAALLLVLGFLGRSLMSSVLTRDIEQFQASLQGILTRDIEQFKATLQVAAVEHQVRFSRLLETQSEVLAELYKLLVIAIWKTTDFSSQMQFVGDPDKKSQPTVAIDSIAEYFRFFDQHQIWLPPKLCASLEAFAKKLRTPTMRLGVFLSIDNPTAGTMKQTQEVWQSAWDSVQNDIPTLRRAIEVEFRALLGPNQGKPSEIPVLDGRT